jgi:Tfp pilus assembly protein PilF
MKKINIDRFIQLVEDIQKDEDREFCFILGAGASASAKIPTASQLASEWHKKLKKDLEEEYKKWELSLNVDEKAALNRKDFGFLYSKIYSKRFEFDKQSGYNELINAMKGKEPSYGHIIMAWILQYTRHNTIVTTNFDGLLETAIYKYSSSHPMVCGHESMTQYAKPSKEIPLIVKVHRDLFTDPMSKDEEISKLETSWKPVLDKIIGQRTPIVIGYGGNDGSLMTYLETMTKPDNIFWCLYKEEEPNDRIKDLIEKHQGVFVVTDGFDDILRRLLVPFPEIQGEHKKYEEMMTKKLKELDAWLREDNKKTHKRNEKQSAYEYYNLIEKEPNIEKKYKLFQEALNHYSGQSWINGNYANFLKDIKKDYNGAERYYKKALELDQVSAINNGNYAIFLTDIKKDYDGAERYYKKALELDPNRANTNDNYAVFLKNIKKDYDGAERYYKKALELDPNRANTNYNYAVFLKNIKKDYDGAERYYKKALELDPDSADNNSNYAVFLKDIKKDYDGAERYYKKALELDPDSADNNGNYANFLIDIKKDYDGAEWYYKKALELDPDQANNNGNYALFLKDIKKDYDEAEKYYKKSLELDPDQANTNGNYAQFLFIQKRKIEAIEYLNNAFAKCDDDTLLIEIWFYRYAHIPEYMEEAEKNVLSLLEKGAKSIGWNFEENIKVAIEENHPHMDKLRKYADLITLV